MHSVVMPSEDTKILEFNQYQKSDKTLFIICSGLESGTGQFSPDNCSPGQLPPGKLTPE